MTPDTPDTNAPANPQADNYAAAAEADFDLSQFTILLVDDNEQNLELLQAYLEPLPCALQFAHDGDEALRLIDEAEADQPDLLLLDVMMPRVSGFEVCRKLKANPDTRTIPVMMVTALNELGDVERGVESGTDDFVSKPVNKLELITRVKSLLRMRHLKRELDRTEAHLQQVQQVPGESREPSSD
jgi:CheY-like chemotaxis protein